MRGYPGLLTLIAVTACMGQQQPPQPTPGARDLFFVGAATKDELPPIPNPGPRAPAAAKTPAKPPATAALHLGLRYTLLLVKSPGGRGEATDPERNFRKGDCVAIELEANRSGYLYVLAKESSGDWTPLFPTPELSDQSNRIDPGQIVRTPKTACFEIEDPPGTETLFVVLSRNPRDISQLAEGIKGPGNPQRAPSAPTQIADAGRINSAVEQISNQFGTRDLPFTEVVKPTPAPVQKAAARPADKREPQHAVYVVNGSSKPESTLVTRVEIRHR